MPGTIGTANGLNAAMAGQSLVLFDGVCNLCDAAVRFIIANDTAGRFRFAALESAAGRRTLAALGRDTTGAGSIVVIDETGVYDRSSAGLRIVRGLRAPWNALAVIGLIPLPLRDRLYAWVARHRYGWFGRRATCTLPSPDTRDHFVA